MELYVRHRNEGKLEEFLNLLNSIVFINRRKTFLNEKITRLVNKMICFRLSLLFFLKDTYYYNQITIKIS